jgi:hypothetical protein
MTHLLVRTESRVASGGVVFSSAAVNNVKAPSTPQPPIRIPSLLKTRSKLIKTSQRAVPTSRAVTQTTHATNRTRRAGGAVK